MSWVGGSLHEASAAVQLDCPNVYSAPSREMVFIPQARVTLGVSGSLYNPIRTNTVSGFCIDVTEVSDAVFLSHSQPRIHTCPSWATSARFPATCLTWNEAEQVCAQAGKRLPTQDEWELAAMGVQRWTRPSDGHGSELRDDEVRSHFTNLPLHTVGSERLDGTVSGVRDLLGNVAEWTQTPTASGYVIRGGSFQAPIYDLRFAHEAPPSTQRSDLGFRCASTPIRH
jgi:formylglycine-generating enzyme required for sulfatase activity